MKIEIQNNEEVTVVWAFSPELLREKKQVALRNIKQLTS